MKKYLRLNEILSKTFIYSFIFLKMKILLGKPGELPEISTRPTCLTLALVSGRALISNPGISVYLFHALYSCWFFQQQANQFPFS